MSFYKKILLLATALQLMIGGELSSDDAALTHPWSQFSNRGGSLSRIGDFTYPTNPMNDRAIGYLLKGKAKSAVTNYGEFIEWDVHPAGLWGDYTYLPAVCFIAGVPGQSYSYKYEWFTFEEDPACPVSADPNFLFWCSSDAYNDPGGKAKGFPWYDDDGDTNFVNIVFESYRDVNGILGKQKFCATEDNCTLLPSPNADPDIYSNAVDSLVLGGDGDPLNEWVLDDQNQLLVISLPTNGAYVVDPNYANTYGDPQEKKTVGLVYPWAMRPALEQRTADFDLYDYGEDDEEWTEDDGYAYYGANVAESWFTRWNPSSNTDWQPATGANIYTHNSEVNAGDIFADQDVLTRLSPVKADFIYGDAIVNKRVKKAKKVSAINGGMITSHQAMIYNRKCLVQLEYDESYIIAADYKFTLQFLKQVRIYCRNFFRTA